MANVTGFNTANSNSSDRTQRAAASRIAGFAKRYSNAHCNLARHAAFPLALTPNLLYQIWATFVPETPWISVSHVLLSRLCRSVGYELYEMDIAVRNQLLAELKEQYGQQRFNDLAEFLQDYVVQQLTDDDPNTQELAQAQEWTALAYTKAGQMARELAEALSDQAKADPSEVFRLTSLAEILAEPLIEAGFEPLLIYSNGLKNYARGDQEEAIASFARLPGGWQRAQTAGVGLAIPDQMKAILEEQITVQESEIPKIYALLIGIDYYLPNKPNEVGGSRGYGNYQGCVNDIRLVEAFLNEQLGVPPGQLFKLTSSNPDTVHPPEPAEQLPTLKNIIEVFKQITEIAQPGDQIYIHYCGGAGRIQTAYPELKGESGIDTALVPMDVGNSENYLRDVEFITLLKRLTDKGLFVGATVDSCHAGGMAYNTDRIWFISPDKDHKSPSSLVASREELISNWINSSSNLNSNYIFLAACRPNENSFEYVVNKETKQRSGALTYWLIDTLHALGTNITYQQLFNRVFAQVQSKFSNQTPQLYGDGNRLIFRQDRIQIPRTVTVIKTELEKQMILLNAGLAQGVKKGQQFALYPPQATDLSQADKRLAIVEVTKCEATSSQASITTQFYAEHIGLGNPAIPISAGASVVKKVCLVGNSDILAPLKDAIASESGWLELTENSGDEASDFIVGLTSQQEYEICDPAGQAVSHIPLVSAQDEDAVPYIVKLLTHLAKYVHVQQLNNPHSKIDNQFTVEMIGWQADYRLGARPSPQPFSDPYNLTLNEGTVAFLKIVNRSERPLNIVVMSLDSDWSIEQVYPQNAPFLYFDPHYEMILPLQGIIPFDSTASRKIIKVFATEMAAEFHWLELPQINQIPRIKTNVQQVTDTQALAMQQHDFFEQSRITHRAGIPVIDPNQAWAVKQISIHIQRL